jgi:glycosyltransferase involved in cell wall biosynthesis
VIAISDGVAEDVAATAHLPRGKIQTIYNPVVAPDLMTRARAAVQHPWLAPGAWPVVLGVGRLKPAKDFATLIRAFARVRRERGAHLVILGEGEERPALEALARELGVDADVDLPGFVENPQAWMSRASLLALSSRWEGLANVLIEALACGCPVVSTDCPGGPGEVLDRGAFGRLVPVGDHAALADAIRAMLDEPVDRARLRARGASFSIASSARAYLAAMLPDECPR